MFSYTLHQGFINTLYFYILSTFSSASRKACTADHWSTASGTATASRAAASPPAASTPAGRPAATGPRSRPSSSTLQGTYRFKIINHARFYKVKKLFTLFHYRIS